MVTIDLDEVRGKLLDRPQRQDIILNAVHAYNERAVKAADWLKKAPGKETLRVKAGLRNLDNRISALEQELEDDPSDVDSRQQLDDKRSGRKFLDLILGRLEGGMGPEQALEQLPEPERVSNYGKAITLLRDKGVIRDVSDKSAIARDIRSVVDYEVILMDRRFGIPAPFTYRLIKTPKMHPRVAVDIYLDHLVDQELRKAGRDPGKMPKKKKNAIRRSLREKAKDVVTDMMVFEPVYLVPVSKRVPDFEEKRVSPDDRFGTAFSRMSADRNYLTIAWTSFDQRRVMMLTDNNSRGLRMHIYSALLRGLEDYGIDVPLSEMTRVSESYAHGIEGHVMSRSGERPQYDPWLRSIPSFRYRLPREAFSMWVNLAGSCNCPDWKYVSQLHRRGVKHGWTYPCKHMASLAGAHLARVAKGDGKVLSQFLFPREGQVDFEQKVAGHVLFTEIDGSDYHAARRLEREWLNMENVRELGYSDTYTTDFSAAEKAMRSMTFG